MTAIRKKYKKYIFQVWILEFTWNALIDSIINAAVKGTIKLYLGYLAIWLP